MVFLTKLRISVSSYAALAVLEFATAAIGKAETAASEIAVFVNTFFSLKCFVLEPSRNVNFPTA